MPSSHFATQKTRCSVPVCSRISYTPAPTLAIGFQSSGISPSWTRRNW